MKLLLTLIVATYAALSSPTGTRAKNVDAIPAERFTIDLDLPPGERWAEVTEAYAPGIVSLLKLTKSMVSKDIKEVISGISRNMKKYVPYPYDEEIIGIAKRLGNATLEDVLLSNIFYELVAYKEKNATGAGQDGKTMVGCTSIVAETMNNTIFHGRNLDYPFVKVLRNVTITVDFQRSGKIVYTGSTFAGYVGLFTGQRPYKYTISLDERHQGKFWMNAVAAFHNGLNSVVQFHIRDALDQDNLSFHDAVVYMADKPLIAPCYVIMGGTRSGEGVVITRDRRAHVNMWKLNVSKKTWYVLETNYDRWTTPPPSDDRRDPAIKAMNALTRANVNAEGLYDVLSLHPVFNNKTTYTVIMSAAYPEIYNTWIRFYNP